MNEAKFNKVVETAKAKAANNTRWTRAIERAAAGIVSGSLHVHLFDGFALVASKNGVYRVNGLCECKAAKAGHRECYHRAAAKLVENYEAAPAAAPQPTKLATAAPVITRSIVCDPRTGVACVSVRCDGWEI